MVPWACPSLAWRGANACGQTWSSPVRQRLSLSLTVGWTDDHSRAESVLSACMLLESKGKTEDGPFSRCLEATSSLSSPGCLSLPSSFSPLSHTHRYTCTHTRAHNALPGWAWALPPDSQVPGHHPLNPYSSPLSARQHLRFGLFSSMSPQPEPNRDASTPVSPSGDGSIQKPKGPYSQGT